MVKKSTYLLNMFQERAFYSILWTMFSLDIIFVYYIHILKKKNKILSRQLSRITVQNNGLIVDANPLITIVAEEVS
jgi:hypothetical protein